MTDTPNHLLTLVEANQSQKEATLATDLYRVDMLLIPKIINRTTNTPPGSPANGDRYIVGSSPTGAWSGKAGNITMFASNAWIFQAPIAGMIVLDTGAAELLVYKGSAWRSMWLGTELIKGSTTYDPPNLNDNTQTTTTVTVTGAALGDYVVGVSFSINLVGIIVTGYVSATDTATVILRNNTGSAVDLGSGTLRVLVQKVS